jgi:hypothetical protein
MSRTTGTSAVVVDASVTIRFLTDEGPWPGRWVTWAEQGAMLLAPVHFGAEVANGLDRALATAARAEGIEVID